jgi:hypothetical protein
MAEPRTLVMTIVEVSWEDASGTLRIVPGRLEDKSAGGACIWVKTPITIGSRLRVQWRFEQFSGIAKYCRSEGTEYRVGIQRDEKYTPIPIRPAANATREARGSDLPVTTAQTESLPKRDVDHEINVVQNPRMAQPEPERNAPAWIEPAKIDPAPSELVSKGFVSTELLAEQPAKRKDAGTERKRMQRNWLGLPHWHHNQDALSGNGNGNTHNDGEKESIAAEPSHATETTSGNAAQKPVFGFQVELLPIEDIYRDAGIMNPPKGYGIRKVVDMLHSEYIRGLAPEMKRAAVLMALDAAGIPLDQLQQDAKARRDALDSYEAAQKKQLEAEWARKGEQNIQIQAELESVKASYMARISRNLDGIAREKATFGAWLAIKQQETQGIMEAADLCSSSSALPSIPPTENSMAKAATAKPM